MFLSEKETALEYADRILKSMEANGWSYDPIKDEVVQWYHVVSQRFYDKLPPNIKPYYKVATDQVSSD